MIRFIILAASLITLMATQSPSWAQQGYGPNPYRFEALAETEQEPEPEPEPRRAPIEVLLDETHPEFRWENFGGDPFARSREHALERLEEFFELAELPEELRVALRQEVADPEAVRVDYLVPGDRLDVSSSGGVLGTESTIHRNVVVVDTPGARAGLSQAIRVEVWAISFTYRGEEYVLELILPEVCGNWSLRITRIAPPPPPPSNCAVLEFNVQDQDLVLFVIQNRNQLPASECWGVSMRGFDNWNVLPNRCDVCPHGFVDAIDEGWPGPVHVSGAQGIGQDGVFQMRVPMEATRGHITLCRWSIREGDDHHTQSCGLTVEPRDWEPDDREEFLESFFIQDRFWNFSGDCPWIRVHN